MHAPLVSWVVALVLVIAAQAGGGGLVASAAPGAAVVPAAVVPAGAPGVPAGGADVTPPPAPPTVTADPLPAWQHNGVVYAQVVVGTTVYATGNFTKIRPPGVAAGGAGEVAAGNIFAFDIRTGERITTFNHSLNAQGLALAASPDGKRVYVGGDFTTVDGQARGHIAAFDVATGALTSTFAPTVSGQVRALAATNDLVYAGGSFESAAGAARTDLAAFTLSGTVTAWNPVVDNGFVWSMVITPGGSSLVVGGSFTTLAGQPAYGMGKLDLATAAPQPWAAQSRIRTAGIDGGITSLRTDGTKIYGGGYAFGAGATFEGTFAADPSDGSILWVNDCLGDIYDVATLKGAVYAVGHPHDCNVIGAFPDTNPRARWQKAIATYDVPTGTNRWADSYGWDFTGLPHADLLHWWPNLAFGTYTASKQAAWSVVTSGDYVVLAGEFPSVNGKAQQGVVRFTMPASAPKKVGPSYNAMVNPIPTSTRSGQVRVRWTGIWDMDDESLTYDLFRNNTLVNTQRAAGTFWSTPGMGYDDTGLTPGTSVRYQLRMTDGSGNVQWSAVSATITVSGAASPAAPAYETSVRADKPSHYWRLDEPTGAATLTDSTGWADLTADGMTLGAPGGVGATAGTGHESASTTWRGWSTAGEQAPTTMSVEAWVKTTSKTGGRIVGLGNGASVASLMTDRVLYLDPWGRPNFGLLGPGSYALVSPLPINDGTWHHVVASLSPAGTSMYVDGRLMARSLQTYARDYQGFWRLGGDSTTTLLNKPSTAALDGAVDEVAVYPSVLSATAVRAHFTAAGGTGAWTNDAYGDLVASTSPDLWWRLNDAAGPTVLNSGSGAHDGVASGDYAFWAKGAIADNADNAATFTQGMAIDRAAMDNPTTYSIGTWFATTSTKGGKLIGFGNNPSGFSSSYDRHLYLTDAGKVRFGVYTGALTTLESPTALNDGAWHYAVATQSPAGMRLYIDGDLVASNAESQAQRYTGYWRIGADGAWAGSSSQYFTGTLDEVTMHTKELTAAQVKDIYTVGKGGSVNASPKASVSASTSGLTASVDGSGSTDPDGSIAAYSWNFGDGSADVGGVTATHTYAASGTYPVTLTVTDDKGATGSHTTQVTVTAPVPNVPPTAAFTATTNDLLASVDATSSSDSDGSIAAYSWDFGDGTPAVTGAKATHSYAAAGTYRVELTVTDDGGATAAVSKQVTVAAPAGPVTLAADAFERTVTGGWGSADRGGTWTTSGSASVWSVATGTGRAVLAAGAGARATLPVNARDSSTRFTLRTDKTPSGGGQYFTVYSRVVGTSDYHAKIRYESTGRATVWLERATPTLTTLTSAVYPFTVITGTTVNVRFDVVGGSPTTLRFRAWKAGTEEPTTWIATATDSTAALQANGSLAFYPYLSSSTTNAPVTYTVDNLSVTPLP